MLCKKCGAAVPDTAAFCPTCGATVEKEAEGLHCKNCGAVIPEGAVFCPACGTAREKEPEVILCKNCGAVIPEGAAFCMACGTARERQPEVVHCAKCGAVIADGAAFCSACGTPKGAAGPVAQAPVSAPPAAKKNSAKAMDKTDRLLLGVEIVCLLLGFLFSGMASSANEAGPSSWTLDAIGELSDTVAMYNGLSFILFIAAGILGVILYIRNKKNKGKQ